MSAPRTNPIKQCRTCGKDFVFQKDTKKFFCSRDCWKMKASSTAPSTVFKKGQLPHNYKGGFPKCLDCGKQLHSYYAKRCLSCSHKEIWTRGIYHFPRGKNHPLWKGGDLNQKYLRRRFQLEIQKSIFERDNYTCQICGIKGVSLQVDHIQPWCDYVELRFSMNNCRTLCAKCHYKITFGKEMPSNIKTWGLNLKNLERERIAK